MKRVLLSFLLFLFAIPSFSQLLSWTPAFGQETSTPFTITLDASKGNQGLFFYTPVTDVYVHIAVITNLSTSSSDWRYSKFTWATTPVAAQATSLGGSKWSYTITGGLKPFFGVPVGETIQKIAILFRNGTGTKVQRNTDGSDMYIPIYTTALAARFTLPLTQPTYLVQPETITKVVGNTIPMTGISNNPATLRLYLNGTVVNTAAAATTISASPVITVAGNQKLVLEADDGVTNKRDTIQFYVAGTVNIASLPAGVRDGINYEADQTAATLVFYAPSKTRVAVIGDLPGSNWNEQMTYQFNKTPDGNYWWLRLTGLTPGTEYSYQYLVDGTLKIGEPYAEKVLDPWNDPFIPVTTYPGLKAYPAGLTSGVVSILQTGQAAYNWQAGSYTRPDKRKLVIYELLLRDFLAKHDWTTLNDTLNYLKNMGITAIELMPINEFEGNLSWGYNPDYYFAPDKYYGPANQLKQFIDNCHKKGIAVVMDIALNHSFGLAPMVQLYWDAVNNRPAANNPWFNPVAKHAYNVGYDMNHESLATRYFVSRVMEHWLTKYKIDGFRFDLSKGFTQTQTCDAAGANCNVGAWGNYDASRVAIWKRYYDTLQLKSAGSYAILEHFADNSEEVDLSNYGMLLWGNSNCGYTQAAEGYASGPCGSWELRNNIFTERGWANPHLVTYMESHDEERLMYNALQFGNSSGGYNIKTLATALKRMELNAAFFYTIPGPKMIYEFDELGYEYSINYCQDGSINPNCRTDSKPLHWEYLQQANRLALYNVNAALIRLRQNVIYTNLFTSNNMSYNLTNAFKWLRVTQGTTHLVVIGNFDVVSQTSAVTFPSAGTWYDYLNGTTITATGASQSFTLQPGEYHVYLNQFVPIPVTLISFTGKNTGNINLLSWTVNNEQDLSRYELERSTDGLHFSTVGSVTATGSSNYSYNDNINGISAAVYYYRLKSIDKDGNYKYSAIVRIRTINRGWTIEATPNPFTEKIQVNIESAIKDEGTMILSDLSGKQLFKQPITLSPGNNAFEITEAGRFSKGIYMLSILALQQKQTIKIVKGN
ncbi:MAG: alpha-amylase family glycosyl hydrolase [Ferruginibacter sp.]